MPPPPPLRRPGEPPLRPPELSAQGVAVPPRHRVDRERLLAAGLAEEGGGHSRIAEEFRLVQQQVLRGAFGADLETGLANLVMVTSSRPNEGKTFTAINLAFSIARRGDHKVLLVDADAKHGSLSDLLGIGEEPGLLDLAADPAMDAGPCLVGTPSERLSILPIGCQRARRGDVFASNNMMRVIQELGQRYADRLVVIDVAPCLSTSDPAMLAGVVGQVLFVVEAESTQRDEVESALDLIQTCPTITLLLNKVQMSTSRSFGAYSYSYSS
ncbi:MAG: chromosome partitioning ATPase [Proteobacteria bacterium]|nr:chromosome partitioning ATPase [Pseudomonadota bacterium]